MAMRRAPASMAFSTSSLTTDAGPLDDLAGGDLVGELGRESRRSAPITATRMRRNQTNIEALARPPMTSSSTHQNCASSPPGSCGRWTFIPYRPVITVSGPKRVAMTASSFDTCPSRFDTLARCASRMPVTRSWKMNASSAIRTSWSYTSRNR
jgi:hypothetical protein